MKYEVKCSRPKPVAGNPFRAGLILERGELLVRTWVMDAESEDEVRAFFKDAKDRDLDAVRGFELSSITEIK